MEFRLLPCGLTLLSLAVPACFPDDPVATAETGAGGAAAGNTAAGGGAGGGTGGGVSLGGANGTAGAAGGKLVEGGASGTSGSAGTGAAGTAGAAAAGGGAGGNAGSAAGAGGMGIAGAAGKGMAGAAGSGTAGGAGGGGSSGKAGAGGQAEGFLPGALDCEDPQTNAAHRFCTDFAPGPTFWQAPCSQIVSSGGNPVFTWQEPIGTFCNSFVRYQPGGAAAEASVGFWLRADAIGFADVEQTVVRVVVGDVNGSTGLPAPGTAGGQIALKPTRDAGGAITGAALVVTSLVKGESAPLETLPTGSWKYLRLRVTAAGEISATVSASDAATGTTAKVTENPAPPASPSIVFPFSHAQPATQPTQISLDEIVVDTP